MTTSKARNSRNPASAPPQPTGLQEQRDQHAHDFVDDDRAGIGAAEVPLGDAAAPRADRERSAGWRAACAVGDGGKQRPDKQTDRRTEGAGRERNVADAEHVRWRARKRDDADAFTRRSVRRSTRVPAKRSCRPRRSRLKSAVRNPRPAGIASSSHTRGAEQRMRRHRPSSRAPVRDDLDPHRHLAERLTAGGEGHQVAAVLHEEEREERRLRQQVEIGEPSARRSAS